MKKDKHKIDQTYQASQWTLMRWKFSKHKVAMISLVFIILMYLGAIFSEFTAPYDPAYYDQDFTLAPPQRIHLFDNGSFKPYVHPIIKSVDSVTWASIYTVDKDQKQFIKLFVRGHEYKMWGLITGNLHLYGLEDGQVFSPMGKDSLGRDILSRIVYGSRISLSIGLIGIFIGFFPSLLLGGLAGLVGGPVDKVIMRVTETFMSIPTIPLWIALSAALPVGLTIIESYILISVILALVGVVSGGSRTIRGKFMALKHEDFITAAELDNTNRVKLIFKYLLPSFLSHTIADLTLTIPGMILGETSLSFIGLGLQPPAISWGVMLMECKYLRNLMKAPWLFIPAVFVVLTILAMNFIGDGLRDSADPYSKV